MAGGGQPPNHRLSVWCEASLGQKQAKYWPPRRPLIRQCSPPDEAETGAGLSDVCLMQPQPSSSDNKKPRGPNTLHNRVE